MESRFTEYLVQLRTDERFSDPHDWKARVEDSTEPPHPVSGWPLVFGRFGTSRPAQTILLHHAEGVSRFLWVRDRVDPVFFCPNRHRFVFSVRTPGWTDPFTTGEGGLLSDELLSFLENAFLQDAEIGLLQCLQSGLFVDVEFASRGMLGPLWTRHNAPSALADLFEADPGTHVFFLPVEEAEHRPGPSFSEDPLSPLYGETGELQQTVPRLRTQLGYRVYKQRIAWIFSTHDTTGAWQKRLSGVIFNFAQAGEP